LTKWSNRCHGKVTATFDQKVKQRSRNSHDNHNFDQKVKCEPSFIKAVRMVKRQVDDWRKGKLTIGEESAQSLFNAWLWTAATKNQKAPRKKQGNTFSSAKYYYAAHQQLLLFVFFFIIGRRRWRFTECCCFCCCFCCCCCCCCYHHRRCGHSSSDDVAAA